MMRLPPDIALDPDAAPVPLTRRPVGAGRLCRQRAIAADALTL